MPAWRAGDPGRVAPGNSNPGRSTISVFFMDPTYPYKPGAFYFGVATPVSIKAINVPTVVVGQPVSVSVSLEVPQGAGKLYYKWGIIDATTGKFVYTSAETTAAAAPITITVPADVTSKLTANRPYKLWILTYAENVPIVAEATQVFVPRAAAPTTPTPTTPTTPMPTTPTPTPTTPSPTPTATTPTTAPSPTAITTTIVAPAAGTTEALAAGVIGILAVLGALAIALRRRGGGGQETKTR
jgi:peptide/nickel transport system substrate-binding protein